MYVCNASSVYAQRVIEIQVSQFVASAVKFNQKSRVRKIIITSTQDDLILKIEWTEEFERVSSGKQQLATTNNEEVKNVAE